MTRLTNAILGTNAYSNGSTQPMLDITNGGQQGWSPNLVEWISNQAYIRRNLVCILLQAPKFFLAMPNPEYWYSSLKALVELHPRTIEGFNAGLTVEFDEHPVGGSGEMQQEFTNVTRARTEPAFTFIERYGRPIQTFLEAWIMYGMMDPNTKTALLGTLPTTGSYNQNLNPSGTQASDLLADWFSMTCLFFEPDPLHKNVQQAWLTTNMMPKGNGEVIGKRDLTAASEVLTLNIEFTGLSQYGLGVNQFAQQVLDRINMKNANPNLRPAWISQINGSGSGVGYDPGQIAGNQYGGSPPDTNIHDTTIGYKSELEDLGTSSVSGVAGNPSSV